MQYDLLLGDTRIGSVSQTDTEFPNLSGTIEIAATIQQATSEFAQELKEFIRLNCECTRLVDVQDDQDVGDELQAVNQQLQAYQDLIERDDWLLIDPLGKRHPILCPILRNGNEIVWRWNVIGQ